MYTLKNSVQLIGNVGNDPKIWTSSKGEKQAKLSLATNESYKNSSGEKISETQWHYLLAKGKLAELIESKVCKGSDIAVEGKLCSRLYSDKNGVRKFTVEIQIRELLILNTMKK